LPRIFSTRSHWTSSKTRILIAEACGGPNNTECPSCGRNFTSHRRLRIHVQQHYVNSFCPCGEFSFQCDYVLKHQRIARCHTGRIFDVDLDNYPSFGISLCPILATPRGESYCLKGSLPADPPAKLNCQETHQVVSYHPLSLCG